MIPRAVACDAEPAVDAHLMACHSGEAVKAVVNVGYSPTFVGAENPEKVVEAHLFKDFPQDFYDEEMRLMLTGFLRPEAKFAGRDCPSTAMS